jgi:hypothetical protein
MCARHLRVRHRFCTIAALDCLGCKQQVEIGQGRMVSCWLGDRHGSVHDALDIGALAAVLKRRGLLNQRPSGSRLISRAQEQIVRRFKITDGIYGLLRAYQRCRSPPQKGSPRRIHKPCLNANIEGSLIGSRSFSRAPLSQCDLTKFSMGRDGDWTPRPHKGQCSARSLLGLIQSSLETTERRCHVRAARLIVHSAARMMDRRRLVEFAARGADLPVLE